MRERVRGRERVRKRVPVGRGGQLAHDAAAGISGRLQVTSPWRLALGAQAGYEPYEQQQVTSPWSGPLSAGLLSRHKCPGIRRLRFSKHARESPRERERVRKRVPGCRGGQLAHDAAPSIGGRLLQERETTGYEPFELLQERKRQQVTSPSSCCEQPTEFST